MAEGLKLSALLPARLDGMGEQARRKLCENEEIGCMKLAWDFIAGELHESLKSALDCDLLEVLAAGWAQAELLAEYADPALHPAGERSVVEVAEHELVRELHPTVAVTVGSLPCVELAFTLKLSAHFGGLKLSILNGHITGIGSGEGKVSAQLSYEGLPLHKAAEAKKLAIPGDFRFAAPGVPIPRLRRFRTRFRADRPEA